MFVYAAFHVSSLSLFFMSLGSKNEEMVFIFASTSSILTSPPILLFYSLFVHSPQWQGCWTVIQKQVVLSLYLIRFGFYSWQVPTLWKSQADMFQSCGVENVVYKLECPFAFIVLSYFHSGPHTVVWCDHQLPSVDDFNSSSSFKMGLQVLQQPLHLLEDQQNSTCRAHLQPLAKSSQKFESCGL